jgi:surface antigen
MSMNAVAALLLAAAVAQEPDPQAKLVAEAKAAAEALAKAQFSSTNPLETLRWVTRHHRAYLAASGRGNELADETAWKAFEKEVAKAKGKSVEWTAKVEKVTRDGVFFRDVARLNPDDIDGEKRWLVIGIVRVPSMTDADRKFAESLKPGDEVTVKGKVIAIDVRQYGERHHKEYSVGVGMDKLTMSPKKKD